MRKTVGIGIQDFEKIIERNAFYVDKTRFIREWWDNGDEVTLITRPRRFGKTLTMSMVEHFLSVRHCERNLFEEMEIWKDERMRRLYGTYPVIYLSFSSVKGSTLEELQNIIYGKISDLYNENYFLVKEGFLNAGEEEQFGRMCFYEGEERKTPDSLKRLSQYLHRYYGKKVIILMDEYDTPMQEAYVNGCWDGLAGFMKSLFNATFKDNPYLERAILTGITRVSRESLFSDLNHLRVVTMTSERYSDCFGFTEEEAFTALEEYGLAV